MCKRLAAATVLAMTSIQNTNAQQAWKAMMLHTRTGIVSFVADVIATGCHKWDEFPLQDLDTRGPIELYNPSWFTTHFGWGTWLARCRSWAQLVEASLNGQLVEYLNMSARYSMLFKEREEAVTDAFWDNIKSVRRLLKCYLDGWKMAIDESAFERFLFDNPQSWTPNSMPSHGRITFPQEQLYTF